MSRVGKKPVIVPRGVEVTIKDNEVTVKGPKGELRRSLSKDMEVVLEKGVITVARPSDDRRHRALHGFTRSIIANMVDGVSKGFHKDLELYGVGYRVQKAGKNLSIQVGYTQPVELVPPEGIILESDAPNRITVSGIDREQVGEFAAQIREIRNPDPYLGKGIKYAGEQVRRKAGKSGKLGRKK